jgi:hypothetical protein
VERPKVHRSAVKSWEKLFRRVPASRKAGAVDVVSWVFDNAGTPPHMLKHAEVPNRGAIRYLKYVQADDVNYSEFVRTTWSKTIPSRNQIDWETRYNDDGRRSFGLLDAFDMSLHADNGDDEE